MTEFNKFLLECMNKIKSAKKSVYLLGDFNVNLLNSDKHLPSQEFIDTLFSHAFLPSITKPTRVTNTSATLIDNIFGNDFTNDVNTFSGILYTDISDHFPIFHIDHSYCLKSTENVLKRRMYSHENINNFSTSLGNKKWDHVLLSDNAQYAYTLFHTELRDMYDECFPIKIYKPGYKTRKPWLSEGLKKSIKVKNRLYRKQKKSMKPEHETYYKKYRNKLNKVITDAERKHYDQLLSDNKHNLKKSWQILKDVINKKQSTSACSRFMVDRNITTDKKQISDDFKKQNHKYWSHIGKQNSLRPSIT